MLVFVKLRQRNTKGKTIVLSVEASATIDDVKVQLQAATKVPKGDRHLVFGGVDLKGDCKVSDYNIKMWSVLALHWPMYF